MCHGCFESVTFIAFFARCFFSPYVPSPKNCAVDIVKLLTNFDRCFFFFFCSHATCVCVFFLSGGGGGGCAKQILSDIDR